MQISEVGLNLLKRFEGFKRVPYKDIASIPTIGYGTTIYSNGKRVSMRDKEITQVEAEKELLYYVNGTIINYLNDHYNHVMIKLTQNQFDAIVCLAYNIGLPSFLRSTVFTLIKNNPNDPNIREAWALWNKITVNGTKRVSRGLTERRNNEIELYFKK